MKNLNNAHLKIGIMILVQKRFLTYVVNMLVTLLKLKKTI